MNIGASPMSFTSSSASWKSGDVAPGQFPSGLRVLVVDDDLTCLRILDKMLRTCHYEVTRCSRAEVALKLLRDNKDGYDVVLSDVHMPDMDGFKLLEHIGLEMDLPVIMMSADDSKDVVMKGVTHGACDYLIKPIRMEALKNIWQHVIRKKSQGSREKDSEHSGSEDCEKLQKASEDVDCSSSPNEGNWKSSKKRKDEDDDADERDDSSALKKPRVVWVVDLHQQFVNAVNQLGIDKAVPKKILELMNVPGLTRENVASHLQKYRLYLRRLSHQSGLGNSFMGPSDVQFGSMTPLHGLDLQFASSGQLPPQSLATIQAAVLNGVPSKPTFQSLADQRNIFSFENPKIRFSDVQQQNGSNNQTNLLHGIPTNMDSKQLAALQQSAQPFGSMNMHIPSQSSQNKLLMPQVVQTQPGNQPLNEVNPGHVLNLPSSGSQPISSSGISNGVMGRSCIGNVHLPTYSPASHHSSVVDYSRNQQQREMPGNVFSFGGNTNSRATSLASKGTVEEACNSEIRGSRGGFGVNYGPSLNDLNRSRTGDWNLKTAGPMYESRQQPNLQVRMDVAPSVVVQPLSTLEPRNAFSNSTTISRPHTTPMADIYSRIKAEKLPDIGFHNDFYPNPFDGDDHDIINALQQQDGLLDFDFHAFDNLPV